MKKQTAYVLIAVLIVLQLYSFIKINSLQNMIQNINSTIYTVENNLDNQISSIYQNFDQELKEQSSLINNSFVKLGELDSSTVTLPITFTVKPKTVTETMSVYLDFNGEIVLLERSGVEYYITKDFEISEEISPTIIIEDNGVKNIEDHKGLRISNIKEKIFPYISVRFYGESSHTSKDHRAKGNIEIKYKPAQENNPFTDMKYVIKIDDEIIKETPVVIEKESSGRRGIFTLKIEEKYSLNEGQIFTSNVVAVDSFGFTYECLVKHFVAGSDEQREPYFEEMKIIAPNGEVVKLVSST